MSIKRIVICDGCGRELTKTSQIYHLVLKTDKYWDGVDYDENLISLDFCSDCARDIKETLKKIAKKGEKTNG